MIGQAEAQLQPWDCGLQLGGGFPLLRSVRVPSAQGISLSEPRFPNVKHPHFNAIPLTVAVERVLSHQFAAGNRALAIGDYRGALRAVEVAFGELYALSFTRGRNSERLRFLLLEMDRLLNIAAYLFNSYRISFAPLGTMADLQAELMRELLVAERVRFAQEPASVLGILYTRFLILPGLESAPNRLALALQKAFGQDVRLLYQKQAVMALGYRALNSGKDIYVATSYLAGKGLNQSQWRRGSFDNDTWHEIRHLYLSMLAEIGTPSFYQGEVWYLPSAAPSESGFPFGFALGELSTLGGSIIGGRCDQKRAIRANSPAQVRETVLDLFHWSHSGAELSQLVTDYSTDWFDTLQRMLPTHSFNPDVFVGEQAIELSGAEGQVFSLQAKVALYQTFANVPQEGVLVFRAAEGMRPLIGVLNHGRILALPLHNREALQESERFLAAEWPTGQRDMETALAALVPFVQGEVRDRIDLGASMKPQFEMVNEESDHFLSRGIPDPEALLEALRSFKPHPILKRDFLPLPVPAPIPARYRLPLTRPPG